MNEIIKISGIFPQEVSTELYETVLAIYPEAWNRGSINVRLPKGDPRITQIPKVLQECGVSPRDRHQDLDPSKFTLKIMRVYETQDYKQAAYLVPKPHVSLGSAAERSVSGLLSLEDDTLELGEDIGFSTWAWIVVSTRLKEKIEQSDLKRIVLRPTEVVGSRRKRFQGQFWELTSDLFLPALSSYCRLITNEGQQFAGDYNQGCHYIEGLYDQGEYHYNAREINELPFDLALTQERFGIRERVAKHSLIASARFYEFCVANNLKMKWIPVRLDNGTTEV